MNHDILKRVIDDYRDLIRKAEIVDRDIAFEENGNYVLVGPRRAGKSTILYKRARDLVRSGVSYDQIIFLNFEDERLAGFSMPDFEDIVLVAKEMCGERTPYYFLDEMQTVDGWERFARRLSDFGERVYITGSNAKMLSREVESRLGGRYMSKTVYPYSFAEYVRASKADIEGFSSSSLALSNRLLGEYFVYGGFPATLLFQDRRGYLSSVYEKILLGDIIERHSIRNAKSLRLLIAKIAETICSEVSYTRLYDIIRGIGFSISKDSIISYCSYCEEAYLLFKSENYYASFLGKESNPRFYFCDNGMLGLFSDRESALLENMAAIALKRRFGDDLYYVKSPKTGIDVDFFLPEQGMAIQACYRLSDSSFMRERDNLIKLKGKEGKVKRLIILTYGEKKEIIDGGCTIEAMPLIDFLTSLKQ